MAGSFLSPDGDLEQIFVTDYNMIDQYAMTGSLWLSGKNSYGQLGISTIADKSSPIQTVASGTNWKSVAGGNGNIYAIKTDGTLWMWGRNNYGQLGNNATADISSPIQTVAGGTNWKLVTGGGYITAAIKTDGTLWLCGYNAFGNIGDSTTVNKSSPVQTIAAGNNWNLVSCGRYHTLAIKTDGTLWSWGRNNWGQLSTNTVANKSSPVQTVTGGTNWKFVSCGGYSSYGIKTDGTLWTWGKNNLGQLGDNTLVDKSSPVQTVAGGTNWKSVAGGNGYVSAIKTDGTLWTWGDNANGQLGNGTTATKSSPIQTVAGGTNWKSVGCIMDTTIAVKTDGTLWLWGWNTYGQLGVNSLAFNTSPVQTIAGGTNWKTIITGPLSKTTAAIYFYDASNQYPST